MAFFGSRPIAWLLIFLMCFQSSSWMVTLAAQEAETTEQAPKKKKRKARKKKAAAAAETTAATDAKKAAPSSSSSRSKSSSKEDEEGEKFLTRLATGEVDPDEAAVRAKAKKMATDLGAQDVPWIEGIDSLGPDESSPVLAESIFGQRGKQRINLIIDDLPIKAVMDQMATEFKLNLVSKAIAGTTKIKASLYDLPLETVFKVLLDQGNLTYEKQNGIIYLQDRGKDKDTFLTEKFYKLKEYADFNFATELVKNIATTRGGKMILNQEKKTIFVIEYKRNLDKIEEVLNKLGYLEDLDPDAATFYYHYLSFSYVDKMVVKDLIEKYKDKNGKYTLDEKSNRYLVFDSRGNFEKMKEALSFIDVPRGQVFIDVALVDLSESDTFKLGVDTQFTWNGEETQNTEQLVTSLAADVTNFFSYKQPSHIDNIKFTGSKGNSKTKILNNPKLMVLNNEKAVIDITEKFPYVTNENNNGTISSKIENVDIGVKLEVTPRINSKREVEMDVKPVITVLKEVKTIITKVVDTNQANPKVTETSSEFPITDERSISTRVLVPTDKTLVIGGLLKESDRKSADKIPGLSRLPLLGNLFKRRNDGDDKSQLFIFITPKIVRNAPESSTFTTDEGKERFAFFPKGSFEEMRKMKKGLWIEKLDQSKEQPKDEKMQTTAVEEPKQEVAKDQKVDFSQFMKKISALKRKETIKQLKKADQQAGSLRKEKGFTSLLDRLKEDIVKEDKEAKTVAKQEKKKKARTPSREQYKAVIAQKDKVIGEKAKRIARLLEMWEKDPVDGVMMDAAQTRKKEEKRKANLEKKKPDDKKSIKDLKKDLDKAEAAKKKAEAEAKKKKMEVFTKGIQFDVLSPLNIKEFERENILEGGFLSSGEVNGSAKKDAKKSTSTSTTKSSDTKKPRRSRRKRKRRTSFNFNNDSSPLNMELLGVARKKKVAFKEETQEMPVFMLGQHKQDKSLPVKEYRPVVAQKMVKTVAKPSYLKVAGKSSTNQHTVTKNRANTSGNTPQAMNAWEKDFFEKDLAQVVFAEFEEKAEKNERVQANEPSLRERFEMGHTIPVPAKKLKPLKRVATKPVKAKAKVSKSKNLPLDFMPGLESPEAARSRVKKSARAGKVRSADPRTQAIFDNLFANKTKKQLGSKSVRTAKKVKQLSRKAKISSPDAKTREVFEGLFSKKQVSSKEQKTALMPVKKKAAPKKKVGNAQEKEFENFLDGLFVETQPKAQQHKTAPLPAKTKKQNNSEQEFMDFLGQL